MKQLPSKPSFQVEKPRAALLAALKECSRSKNLARGKQLHQQAIESGLFSHKFVVNSLINTYSKCGSIADARQVFETAADRRDVIAWTALISGYVENGEPELALELFDQSIKTCVPDERIYVAALSACTTLAGEKYEELDMRQNSWRWLEKGRLVHSHAASNKCSDVFLQCKLVDMYFKCGSVDEARQVFDSMSHRDVSSWNALIQGYVDNGEFELALEFYDRMTLEGNCLPNSRSYTAALSACSAAAAAQKQDSGGGPSKSFSRWLETGRAVHKRALENECSTMFLESAAVDMFVKCGWLEQAREVFDRMLNRDVVAWTSVIMGYVDRGENETALELVAAMVSSGVPADSTTFAAALVACGNLMALDTGREFHEKIRTSGLEKDVVVANSLVDFYGKCGKMEIAKEVFDSIPRKTIVSWTSLMSSYSIQGDTSRVFEMFEAMKEQGVRPNEVTFVCLLTACSHAGLTDKGREYFGLMESGFGVAPTIKHFNCLIDLLGRGNQVEEALKLVGTLPFEPNVVTWTSLLAACRKWNNVEIGQLAYRALQQRTCCDSSFVLMADTLKCVKAQTLWADASGQVHKF